MAGLTAEAIADVARERWMTHQWVLRQEDGGILFKSSFGSADDISVLVADFVGSSAGNSCDLSVVFEDLTMM